MKHLPRWVAWAAVAVTIATALSLRLWAGSHTSKWIWAIVGIGVFVTAGMILDSGENNEGPGEDAE